MADFQIAEGLPDPLHEQLETFLEAQRATENLINNARRVLVPQLQGHRVGINHRVRQLLFEEGDSSHPMRRCFRYRLDQSGADSRYKVEHLLIRARHQLEPASAGVEVLFRERGYWTPILSSDWEGFVFPNDLDVEGEFDFKAALCYNLLDEDYSM